MPPELGPLEKGALTPLHHRVLLTLCLSLAFLWIYSGQVFLAHNADNDADSSFFVYGGKVLLSGGVLYQDFWDQKPPMIFWQNAFLLNFFGRDFHAWAWAHGLTVVTLSLLWLREMRLRIGTPLASVGLLALAFMFNSNKVLDFGNRTEFGVACFELLALILILRAWRKEAPHSLIFAGGAAAIAFLYKPVGMASLLATIAWSSFKMGQHQSNSTLKPSLTGFIGCLFLLSIPLFISGQWKAMFDASIFIPLQFSGTGSPDLGQATWSTFLRLGPFWGIGAGLFALPLALWLSQGNQRRLLIWVLLWFLATLCGVILQRHGRPHYDHPLAAPMVTLVLFSLHPILKKIRPRIFKASFLFGWLFLILFFGHYFIRKQVETSLQLPHQSSKQHEAYQLVGDFIQSKLEKDETFYYWSLGFSPYLLAERFSPGRLSPSILTFGGHGVDLVRQDLEHIKSQPNVKLILENPDSFPKDMLNPNSEKHSPEAVTLVREYLAWKAEYFHQLKRPDLLPFRVFLKKESD